MVKSQDSYLKKRAEENFDLQADTCSMFHEIIMDCGELLKKCHTEEEVREMRDEYIIQLVGQYDQQQGFDAHQCDIVREYRESERFKMETADEHEDCNDRKSARVRADVQTCNRKYAAEAHEKLQDVSDANIIRSTLCQAFTFIATTCSAQLKECATSEDFVYQRNSNLGSMKKFLLTLAENAGVDKDVLDNCPAVTTNPITQPPEQRSMTPRPQPNTVVNEVTVAATQKPDLATTSTTTADPVTTTTTIATTVDSEEVDTEGDTEEVPDSGAGDNEEAERLSSHPTGSSLVNLMSVHILSSCLALIMIF